HPPRRRSALDPDDGMVARSRRAAEVAAAHRVDGEHLRGSRSTMLDIASLFLAAALIFAGPQAGTPSSAWLDRAVAAGDSEAALESLLSQLRPLVKTAPAGSDVACAHAYVAIALARAKIDRQAELSVVEQAVVESRGADPACKFAEARAGVEY